MRNKEGLGDGCGCQEEETEWIEKHFGCFLKAVGVLCCDVSMIPVSKLNDTDFEKCD